MCHNFRLRPKSSGAGHDEGGGCGGGRGIIITFSWPWCMPFMWASGVCGGVRVMFFDSFL